MLSRRRILLGGAALGLVGCGSPDNLTNLPGSTQPSPSPAVQLTASRLFVLNAQAGTRSGNQMRLTQVAPDVVWFDDRPARAAGRQTTLSFVQNWSQQGFDSDPPNAVLQVDNLSFPVILSLPVFDGPAQAITFTIQSDLGAPPLDQLPVNFGPCALFIDDGGFTPQAAMAMSLHFSMKSGDSVEVTLVTDQMPVSFAIGEPGVQSGLLLNSIAPAGPLTVGVFFSSILVTSGGVAEFDLNVFLLSQPGIQTFRIVAQGPRLGSQVSVTDPVAAVLSSLPTQIGWVDL